jgi:hypothetical protein
MMDEDHPLGRGGEPGVRVVAEIRCTACTGKRGKALLAVVYSDGRRRWLVMNPPDGQLVSLVYMVRGNDSWPGLQSAHELEELRRDHPVVVWLLEHPSAIGDPNPLASVSCPHCSPSGFNSSWFIDIRKLAESIVEGKVTKLGASEVSYGGEKRPTLDRDLGYSPHTPVDPRRWGMEEPDR